MMLLISFLLLTIKVIFTSTKVWPSGSYGLPKAISGCPPSWSEGWRKQDLENNPPHVSSFFPSNLQMEATLTNEYINRSFCIKTVDNGKNIPWPTGSYCVYKKLNCPSGMSSGSIYWDDEDSSPNENDRYGVLPDGQYDSDTKIYYCCQDQGQWYNPIELPVDQPFYLLPHNSANCQRVKWALSRLEYIVYDTEDDNNHDSFNPDHLYTDGNRGLPKVYYCYYEGCRKKLGGNQGNFSSVNYPDHQYCSWLITVQDNFLIVLTFININIFDCNKNYMEIYDGQTDSAPLLARYCDSSATAEAKLLSTGKSLYIVFKSGYNSPSSTHLGFSAKYQAISSSSSVLSSWPSGTYSLPKASSGCPQLWSSGWRKQAMDDKIVPKSSFSSGIHMEAVLTSHYITRGFCTKTIKFGKNKLWPPGW